VIPAGQICYHPFLHEQVEQQLMRFGAEHAEMRAEVMRGATTSNVAAADKVAKRDAWQVLTISVTVP